MEYLTNKILKYRCELDDLNLKPNETYEYIPTDSKEYWDRHIISELDKPSIQYYELNPIEYKLNNAGFRTPDDFNSYDEGDVYLGCSHTFGIGHHLENVWSYKLSKILGRKFWNLGIGGTGTDTHFRLLFAFYKELKIKNIFHYAPLYPRYEFIENGRPHWYIIANYNKNWESKFGNLMKESLLTNEQVELNWHKNTSAIRGLASEIGANYYVIEGSRGWHGRDDESLLARDLLHHTTKYHHSVYQDFLKLYDDNLYSTFKDVNEPIMNIKKYMKDNYTKSKLI